MNKFCSTLGIIILGIADIYSGCGCCGGSCKDDNEKGKGIGSSNKIKIPGEEDKKKLKNFLPNLNNKKKRNKGIEDEKFEIKLTISNNKIICDGKEHLVVKYNIPRVTDNSFNQYCKYYKIDKELFDNIKKNINSSFISNSEDIDLQKETPYLIVAVLCDDNEYYIIYCKNANSNNITGLFEGGIDRNNLIKVKIICNGEITNCPYMFYKCKELIEIDLSKFDTSNVTNMRGIFRECKELKSLDLSNFNTKKVTDMSQMFYECKNLKNINLTSKFKTNNVGDMKYMFCECKLLKSLNLTSFNTENVKYFDDMFEGCNSLENLTLSDSFKPTSAKNNGDCVRLFGNAGKPNGLKINNINKETLKSFIIDQKKK